MKDILDLNYFKITNNPTPDREGKKVRHGVLYQYFYCVIFYCEMDLYLSVNYANEYTKECCHSVWLQRLFVFWQTRMQKPVRCIQFTHDAIFRLVGTFAGRIVVEWTC